MGGFGIGIDGNLKICKFENGLKGVIKNEELRIKTWHVHKGIGSKRQYLTYLTTRDDKEFCSAHRASLSPGAPHHAHTPRTRRAPRYVHGLAGPPQGVRDRGKH